MRPLASASRPSATTTTGPIPSALDHLSLIPRQLVPELREIAVKILGSLKRPLSPNQNYLIEKFLAYYDGYCSNQQYKIDIRAGLETIVQRPVTETLNINDLKRISTQDSRRLAQVLNKIDPEELVAKSSKDLLAWILINEYRDLSRNIKDHLDKTKTYDTELLLKARNYAFKSNCTGFSNQYQTTMHYYQLLLAVKDKLGQIDLTTLIKTATHRGQSPRAEKYKLIALLPGVGSTNGTIISKDWGYKVCGDKVNDYRIYNIALDAPIAFALAHNNEPAYVWALQPSSPHTLKLVQMQVVKPYQADQEGQIKNKQRNPDKPNEDLRLRFRSKGLDRLNLNKIQLAIPEAFAALLGQQTLEVQKGSDNYWTKPRQGETEEHLPIQVAQKYYDRPARQAGYRLVVNCASSSYVKHLSLM